MLTLMGGVIHSFINDLTIHIIKLRLVGTPAMTYLQKSIEIQVSLTVLVWIYPGSTADFINDIYIYKYIVSNHNRDSHPLDTTINQ